MDNSNAEFTTEEQAEFARLEQEASEQPLPVNDHQANPPAADATAGKAEEPKAAAAAEPAKKEDSTPEPAKTDEDRPQGDLRQALRAARRSERHARAEADRLAKENAELKAKAPNAEPKDALTDELLTTLEQDYPTVAPVAQAVRALKTEVEQLRTSQPRAEPAKAEFAPEQLPEEVQDLVDANPDLLDWHSNPDQTRWEMVKQADRLLIIDPTWGNKSDAERAVEAVRLVKERLGEKPSQPKQPTAAEIARQRIENAPELKPAGISDIRGGSTTERPQPDYAKMTDDDILASIPEY